MHDELEAALKELEAKMPNLRHLILDSGGVMAASPVALALAARLLRLTAMADETASNLRLALLGSNPPPPQPLPALPLHLPEPEGASPPPPPPPPADFLNEADHALLEIFGEGIGEAAGEESPTLESPAPAEAFDQAQGAFDVPEDARWQWIENARATLRLQEDQFRKSVVAGDQASAWEVIRWKENFEARLRGTGIAPEDLPELTELAAKIASWQQGEKTALWVSPEVMEEKALQEKEILDFIAQTRRELARYPSDDPARKYALDEATLLRLAQRLPRTLTYRIARRAAETAIKLAGVSMDAAVRDMLTRSFEAAGWLNDEDDSGDTPGNAPVPAIPTPPIPPRVPGNARTYDEALEPARNP